CSCCWWPCRSPGWLGMLLIFDSNLRRNGRQVEPRRASRVLRVAGLVRGRYAAGEVVAPSAPRGRWTSGRTVRVEAVPPEVRHMTETSKRGGDPESNDPVDPDRGDQERIDHDVPRAA